jgi:hypothetical protein|tara:strand:- start:808 stop:1128 length:321 start_codon:yes stop_codon:yes gene_type:complete
MTYVFDIDGTICSIVDGDYEKATPFENRIMVINELYEEGNMIHFLTARGMGRTDNSPIFAHRLLYKFTKDQLDSWGVKYHKLFLGKPSGDIYIDDKGARDVDFFRD